MAFEYTVEGKTVMGNKRVHFGTFTNGGGDSGGDIVTGLRRVEFISLQHTGAAAIASAPVVNETIPATTGTMTIVTTAGADGVWWAMGY